MSKHLKEVRHKRRKVERRRRRLPAAKHGAAALAAAAAIAAGTQAYADPVRFDNPEGEDHFVWAETPGAARWNYLDLTLPAEGQLGTVNSPTALAQEIAGSENYGLVFTPDVGVAELECTGLLLQRVGSGTPVPSGSDWRATGYQYYYGDSLLAEGVETYLGVRFDLGGGNQYGWVGVVRDGAALDAFAWGYETEVGVPIAAGAPEPGTLALLAMGAVGVMRRRR